MWIAVAGAPVNDLAAMRAQIIGSQIRRSVSGYVHGEKIANPADDVGPALIATFVPKDRSLPPTEIRIMLKQLEHVATLPTIRLGMRLFLLTMVRKSELQDVVWDEVVSRTRSGRSRRRSAPDCGRQP